MSKNVKFLGIIILVAAAVVSIGVVVASAQRGTPPAGWVPGMGQGMMGGRGMMGAYANGTPAPDAAPGNWGRGHMEGGRMGGGLMAQFMDQDAMHAAIAQALGMSVEDFEAALAAGQTPYELAQERGVEWATVQTAMQQAHRDAIQSALAAGEITQEQADWMLSHIDQMGQMMGGGHMHMGGQGWDCPNYPGAAPTPQA